MTLIPVLWLHYNILHIINIDEVIFLIIIDPFSRNDNIREHCSEPLFQLLILATVIDIPLAIWFHIVKIAGYWT